MKLTPFAKLFITVVILAVLGYVFWHAKGAAVREWATGKQGSTASTAPGVTSSDFDALKNAPPDPNRNAGSTGVSNIALGQGGRLSRPLVVAINTWAGHSPGIVFNDGLEPGPASQYKQRYGLDVKFVLLEDPAAKLAAFRKGDVDIMATNTARYEQYLSSVDLNALSRERTRWEVNVKAGKEGDAEVEVARKNLAIVLKRIDKLQEIKRYMAVARGQLDLIDNSFQLIADQIVTMQSPQQLSGQLDELLDGVESIRQTAVDTERILNSIGSIGNGINL